VTLSEHRAAVPIKSNSPPCMRGRIWTCSATCWHWVWAAASSCSHCSQAAALSGGSRAAPSAPVRAGDSTGDRRAAGRPQLSDV